MNTPTKAKYRHRIEEGYDLPGSPVFTAWKRLYQASQPEKEKKSSVIPSHQ